MLQRVGIAQAILHDPKLVFLDEPMRGLDPLGRREVRDLIQQLNEEGKTIFFSTHILSDAETLCDRVAVLNKGELKGVGVVAELLREVSGKWKWSGRGTGDSGTLRAGRALPRDRRRRPGALPERRWKQPWRRYVCSQAHLTSVTPVRATLEDYFLARIGDEKPNEVNA